MIATKRRGRLVVVHECGECPYHYDTETDDAPNGSCECHPYVMTPRAVPHPLRIPRWCPLAPAPKTRRGWRQVVEIAGRS